MSPKTSTPPASTRPRPRKRRTETVLERIRGEVGSFLRSIPVQERTPELRSLQQLFEQLEQQPLLPVTLDYVFKRVFEDDLDVLASLLNAILHREGSKALTGKSLTIVNPIQHRRHGDDKSVILDILVQSDEKESFDVEMQFAHRADSCVRALYYGSRLLVDQLEKGRSYAELRPIKVIFFMAFEFFEKSNDVHSVFEVQERTRHTALNNLLELHFLELPKLGREKAPVDTPERLWLQYLKGASAQELKELVMSEPMIGRAVARQHELSRQYKARMAAWLRLRNYIEGEGVKEWGERMRQRAEAAELALQLEQESAKARAMALVEKEKALVQKDQALAQEREANARKEQALVQQNQALAKEREANARNEQALVQKDQALAKEREANARKEQALAQQNQALITSTRLLLAQRFGTLPPELEQGLQHPSNAARLAELLPRLLTARDLPELQHLLRPTDSEQP